MIAAMSVLAAFTVDLALAGRQTWIAGNGGLPVHLQDRTFLAAFCLLPGLAFCQYLAAYAGWDFTALPRITLAHFALTSAAALALYRMIAVRPAHELWFLSWALALILLGEAGYALLNLASGNESLLLSPRRAYLDSATGTLVSRNHFAFLMEMGVPLWVGLVAASSRPDSRGSDLPESENRMRQLLMMAPAIVLFLALLFSRSRMGVFAAVASGVGAILLAHWRNETRQSRSRAPISGSNGGTIGLVLVVVTLALLYGALAGFDEITERFMQLPADLESGRMPLWELSLAMFADRPLFGHGFGSFEHLIDLYRANPNGLTFAHVHNEYLELMMEAGLVGVGTIIYLLGSYLRFTLTALGRCRSATAPLLIGAFTGLNAVLLHSSADFGLRIPGVLLCFAYLAGLASLAASASRGSATRGRGRGRNQRSSNP